MNMFAPWFETPWDEKSRFRLKLCNDDGILLGELCS